MYRFENTAVWHKAIESNDNEQSRPAVAGHEFRCFSSGKVKGNTTIIDGVRVKTSSIVLQTDDEIAIEIEADDKVVYEDRSYFVDSVQSVKSFAYKGAKEYLVFLK